MPTQKNVEQYLKELTEAIDFKAAVKWARATVAEFDGLTEESARNLLQRTPMLMVVVGAFQAGADWSQELRNEMANGQQVGLL